MYNIWDVIDVSRYILCKHHCCIIGDISIETLLPHNHFSHEWTFHQESVRFFKVSRMKKEEERDEKWGNLSKWYKAQWSLNERNFRLNFGHLIALRNNSFKKIEFHAGSIETNFCIISDGIKILSIFHGASST
jgi:hypothetical protein